jgi:hypothetical protein
MLRVSAVAALVVATALLAAEGAMACSCVAIDPKTQLEQSDGAVVARLLKVKPLDDIGSSANFVYRTGRVLKGRQRGLRRGRRLVVRGPLQSASCGLSNDVGALTGLFMFREKGRWTSNLCLEIGARQMRKLEGASAAKRRCP